MLLRVKKVFNNNTVLVNDSKGLEKILIGRGIAFGRKVGQTIDEDKIDKTFIVDSPDVTNRFIQLTHDIPVNHLDLVTQVVKDAEAELGQVFDEMTYMGLADHINYAISRYKRGHEIKNALLLEIKKFYPKEYQAALKSLKTISYYENIHMMEDEAGFIALHFVNGQETNDIDYTLMTTEVLKKVVLILEDMLSITLNEESLNYLRFVTHLRFFLQRIASQQSREKDTPEMLHQVRELYPQATECVEVIADYIQGKLKCDIYPEEKMYLTLHVQRLIK